MNSSKSSDKSNNTIIDELLLYRESDIYPFHMPGHKRQYRSHWLPKFPNPFSIDITEVEGFDDLHHAEGILKVAMNKAASVYGSDATRFLVNGSSSGILSAISGLVPQGGTILMARNCHKSAYHAALLRNLTIEYVYPEVMPGYSIQGGVSAESIAKCLADNPKISAVTIVSPTYDGIVSDIERISDIVHKHGIPLIVDEAHGAHLSFMRNSAFPRPALDMGADVVIQSVHKTLPSLTQTAVIHTRGRYVSVENIDRFLRIYQSSSPSYVLLASIESCIQFMSQSSAVALDKYYKNLDVARKKLAKLHNLKLLMPNIGESAVYGFDPSKIVISTHMTDMSGTELDTILRDKYRLEMEMCGASHITAITTLFDTNEGLVRLVDALVEIDTTVAPRQSKTPSRLPFGHNTEQAITISEAFQRQPRRTRLADATGCISTEFVYIYPPGIPIIAPGEIFTVDIINTVERYQEMNLPIHGPQDEECRYILVVDDVH